MNSEWQSLQPQTQKELKNTMNAMQPPQSIEEIKAGLETTEKGGVRQSIRNCLTVFQRDPLLSGAIAYNILTDRKDGQKTKLLTHCRLPPYFQRVWCRPSWKTGTP